MHKKLSLLQSPAIAGVVKAKNARAAIAEIKNCMYGGASMIDLHLSCLEHDDTDTLRQIIASSKLPVLALNYNSTYDWADAGYSEERRADSLVRAVEAGAAGIDMQSYTFHAPSKNSFLGENKYSFTQGNPREIVTDESVISRQCELIEKIHHMGAEVLISCHPGIAMKCEQVVELALFLEKRSPDVIKIVTSGTDTEEDLIECFRTMITLKKELKTPVSYHSNGKAANLTRIINPILGGHIIFGVDRFDEGSTMAQVDLRTAKAIVENIQKIM